LHTAICALSPSSDPSYLAFPSPVPNPTSPLSTPAQSTSKSDVPLSGDVLLYDAKTLSSINVIQAHKSPLSQVAINSTGTLLATSSEKGTVIRVFAIPSADKVYQFRRGTREARIYSISFNTVSTLLAVSSATDTVHIFRLGGSKGSNGEGSSKRQTPSSPGGSVDSHDSKITVGGVEGGYEAFIDGKKKDGNVG
jgi:autophagy-related protein 18